MPGKVILLLPAFLALCCLARAQTGGLPDKITAAYRKADKYFDSNNPTHTTDSLALAGFEQIIEQLEKTPARQYHLLLFQSYLKKGILLDVGNNNEAAKDAYLKAAAVPPRNGSMTDSLLFRPFVYAGTNYFNLNNFDSANYFLIKAEILLSRFPQMPETERLYNTLGALHYVNGNYLQSKNYFEQALEFIKDRKPFDRVFALGLKANIAASFYKLGLYTASLDIYNQIIKEKIPAIYIYNGICMNMGKALVALQKYREALVCFKKINAAETPGVFNEQALAYDALHLTDSANYCLDLVKRQNTKGRVNILDLGINDLYRAGIQADHHQYLPALESLQQAVVIFAGGFTNHSIYTNPDNFSGSYTYYRLFDALYKKAQVFALLYKGAGTDKYLRASLDAYKAAITLLAFIEKSYDTDDAKLFLKKKSQDVYGGAINVCLQLHGLYPNRDYLEQAFLISEKNKASVMAANLRQKNGAQITGIDPSFLQSERNIKFAIARLDVKSEQLRDNAALAKLAKEKAGYEIQLSRLQKQMEQNNHYFQLKYEDDQGSVADLRRQLPADQAVFSFFAATDALHVFAFTKTAFSHTRIEGADTLQQVTTDWINRLKQAVDGRKFKAGALGQQLYNRLVKPMQQLAPGKAEWIIIPDGHLCLLPFESLPDGNTGKTLLETTTISYQFSSRFMHKATSNKNNEPVSVLSFAPFVQRGADYHQQGFNFIDRLPGSGEEITDLQGRTLLNNEATKSVFLQQCGNYPIIHLATHAIADIQNPAASFIAFYPENKLPADNCLYLEEIYGLNMDACKLVVISACETGKGELVNNEGIISLGRAFAYAGCGATINSLWKADDKATAAILKKFHEYLRRGYTKSKALQRARLDFINSDALYKSPACWANLVLTGSIEPVYTSRTSFNWMMAAAACCLLVTGMITRRRIKKSRRFSQLPVVHQ